MNQTFVYCIDSNAKDVLISKGYELIKEESMQDKTAWVFKFNQNIQFDITDKTKYFLSNQLNF